LKMFRVCYFMNCMGQAIPSFRPIMGKQCSPNLWRYDIQTLRSLL